MRLVIKCLSYRSYEIGEYAKAYNKCKTRGIERTECEFTIRHAYNDIESGRLAEMMDKISLFVGHLDRDEIEAFFQRNPEMKELLNEYNALEDLRTY